MKKTHPKSRLVVKGLVEFLNENGQKYLLPQIYNVLGDLVQKPEAKKEVVVTSAVKLSQKEYSQLKKIVDKILGRELPITNKIDKNLIGGFTIKAGDWFLDASLKQELKQLKKVLLQA
ncbi:ATP synthase F1 subunit delta [Candidatus Gottesmanbacteria bacterium]|nr:ATP synthase F1 subunit delta [Candidatus Gottesmanbacteria bacterium]